jgi:hypothetical protein
VEDRSGNGGYAKYLTKQSKDWLKIEAEPAIRNCSLCKTREQKQKMWELTEKKWCQDGEKVMADTFKKMYIDDKHYSNWYYTASGFHGCVPCNNPMERHNLSIKGSSDFLGYVELGRDMLCVLTREFVKLVYEGSTDLTYPRWDMPVLDFNRAKNSDTFLKFWNLFDESVDMVPYGGGWLMNGLNHLSQDITQNDITNMELALAGVIEDHVTFGEEGGEDARSVLLMRTKRFHFVREGLWPVGLERREVPYFHCDCRQFYFERWCFQSAYMQHKHELQLLAEPIKSKSRKATSVTQSQSLLLALTEAERRVKSRRAQRTTNTNRSSNEGVVALLTQDEEE